MKKKYKYTSLIFIVILIIICIIFFKEFNRYSNIINSNWDIDLPRCSKEIYEIDSGPSFHGDGERYHILKYRNTKKVHTTLNCQDNNNLILEDDVKSILNNLNVPIEYHPNFNHDYKFYYISKENYGSKIYMILDDKTNNLYTIEHFQ